MSEWVTQELTFFGSAFGSKRLAASKKMSGAGLPSFTSGSVPFVMWWNSLNTSWCLCSWPHKSEPCWHEDVWSIFLRRAWTQRSPAAASSAHGTRWWTGLMWRWVWDRPRKPRMIVALLIREASHELQASNPCHISNKAPWKLPRKSVPCLEIYCARKSQIDVIRSL